MLLFGVFGPGHWNRSSVPSPSVSTHVLGQRSPVQHCSTEQEKPSPADHDLSQVTSVSTCRGCPTQSYWLPSPSGSAHVGVAGVFVQQSDSVHVAPEQVMFAGLSSRSKVFEEQSNGDGSSTPSASVSAHVLGISQHSLSVQEAPEQSIS